jgi:hypothetical protein
MIDSELVPWGKGEKELFKCEKILKYNTNNLLEFIE